MCYRAASSMKVPKFTRPIPTRLPRRVAPFLMRRALKDALIRLPICMTLERNLTGIVEFINTGQRPPPPPLVGSGPTIGTLFLNRVPPPPPRDPHPVRSHRGNSVGHTSHASSHDTPQLWTTALIQTCVIKAERSPNTARGSVNGRGPREERPEGPGRRADGPGGSHHEPPPPPPPRPPQPG